MWPEHLPDPWVIWGDGTGAERVRRGGSTASKGRDSSVPHVHRQMLIQGLLPLPLSKDKRQPAFRSAPLPGIDPMANGFTEHSDVARACPITLPR